MPNIILINKNGSLEEKKCDKLQDLYKKCGFKKKDNFELRHKYSFNNNHYLLYSKNVGRAGQENKYELPPPLDKELYFGKMCLVKVHNKIERSINKEEWKNIYNKLMGGFEDINDDDEDSDDELENIDKNKKTKNGYLKDDFVVDDDDDEEVSDNENEEECEDDNYSNDDDEYHFEYNNEEKLDNTLIDSDEELNELNNSELDEEDYTDED